ncbi:MAG: hypothetical protein KDD42_08660, partial [Bdellovibrionales bacterium]|nr:hypothetical protein [Bdellovibrionales bacterium]
GVLTANLITVVFVLTSSHLVFLAFAASKSKSVSEVEIAKHAVRHTIHPSFWAMFTTALGFSTYLFVDAKPLREFGISGALASLSAFLAAFMVMPIFLGRDSLSTAKRSSVFWNRSIRGRVGSAIALLLIVAAVLLFSGLLKLNTDPSLLSYFGKNSDLYKGLAYVDRHGGSSPLRLVLYDSSGRSYTDSDVFERAFALQRALESRAEVGSVISLPLIMAEANRAPLSKLLTWDWLLDAVGFAGYQEVVGRFLTADRRFGLFLLRMKELDRKISRGDILKRIESLARTHGFSIYRTGGVFALQNQIGKLIYDSIVTSLLWSIPFFLLSAFVISGSLIVALAVVITVATAPLILLGFAGWLSIPLDLVSVPAATLVTAFGVDAMLHLTHTHMQRRALTSTWLEDASYLRVPILNSAAILGFGFSVLFLSNFPPSVRFGAFLVCGVIISSTATLILLPRIMLVARRQSRFFRS